MSREIEVVNGRTIIWEDPDIPPIDLLKDDPKYIPIPEDEIIKETERIKNAKSLKEDDELFQESLKLLKARESDLDSQVRYKQPDSRFFKIPGGYCIESTLIHNDDSGRVGQLYIPDEIANHIKELINEEKILPYKEVSIKW